MPNFRSINPGKWFYFNPQDQSKGGVCLRELTSEEYDRIEKRTTTIRKKPMRGMVVDDKKEDTQLANRLRWDTCIVDWSEVYLDGELLECTADNKVRMMKVTDFVKFVADSLSELVDTNESLEEARLKNLESFSDGSQENQPVPSV